MRKITLSAAIIFCLGVSLVQCALGAEKKFSTWEGFEPDKLASIWLIKRFVAPAAEINIVPKGKLISDGVQFDTADSDLGRKFNKSTFEMMIDQYRLKDKKLIAMGRLIHDIEINIWERKVFQSSRTVQTDIGQIINKYKQSNDETIRRSIAYFDALYENLPVELMNR